MVQIKQSIQAELLYLPTPAGKAPAQWIQSSRCEGRYVSSCGWCLPESRLIGQGIILCPAAFQITPALPH